jgi:hypothetical protein
MNKKMNAQDLMAVGRCQLMYVKSETCMAGNLSRGIHIFYKWEHFMLPLLHVYIESYMLTILNLF